MGLRLVALPVVRRPDPSAEHEREDRCFGLRWKTRPLVAWAAGRPFIWVDDLRFGRLRVPSSFSRLFQRGAMNPGS